MDNTVEINPESPLVKITNSLRDENKTLLEQGLSIAQKTEVGIYRSNKLLGEILGELKRNKLEEEERRRDNSISAKKPIRDEKEIHHRNISDFPILFFIGNILAGITGMLQGIGEGLTKFLLLPLKGAKTLLSKIIPDGFFRSLGTVKTGIGNSLFNFLDNIKVHFFVMFDDLRKSFLNRFPKTSLALQRTFTPIVNTVKSLPSMVKNFLSPLSKFFGIFRTLGKIFYPITVVIALWDTVRGFIDGFRREGEMWERILGGTFGGVRELVKGLIGLPIDLIKSAISWVFEKLGLNIVSEFLDSFSFTGIFDSLFRFVEKTTFGIIDWIGGFLGKIVQADFWTSLFDSAFSFWKEWTVGFPLKLIGLIKDGVSKVFEHFGMDNWAKAIGNFSLGDMITNVVDGIINGFKDLILGIVSKLPDFIQNRMPDTLRSWLDMDPVENTITEDEQRELLDKRDNLRNQIDSGSLSNRDIRAKRSQLEEIEGKLNSAVVYDMPEMSNRKRLNVELRNETRERIQMQSPPVNVVTDARSTVNNVATSNTTALISPNKPSYNPLDMVVT